jgi:hypothetical protein
MVCLHHARLLMSDGNRRTHLLGSRRPSNCALRSPSLPVTHRLNRPWRQSEHPHCSIAAFPPAKQGRSKHNSVQSMCGVLASPAGAHRWLEEGCRCTRVQRCHSLEFSPANPSFHNTRGRRKFGSKAASPRAVKKPAVVHSGNCPSRGAGLLACCVSFRTPPL